MTCRQYTTAVFDSNAYDLTSEVGSQPQFIAHRGYQHIARTHSACHTGGGTHSRYRRIFCTVYTFLPLRIEPAIAYNTIDSRYAAGINAGMSAGCYRRYIRDQGVLAGKSLVQKTFETAIGCVSVVIPVQVIPAHLVNYNTNHQFGTIERSGRRSGRFSLGRGETINYKQKGY